ncbi:uncharacterized protein N7529_002063 [Penicillium soppii]|uniref:uncharacterized protein n=1 Tax=Penicillium soppii TaxID=69789 RepID=UPI002548B8F5|nr:uncharacterized protein N7529_002063 [Penicillium soppii]KAJ5876479.1 hypothetical protein N7529_002063 [Penicillium soppii]
MSWSEHLPFVLVLCETHVQRAFEKKFNNHEATAVIPLIFSARSKAEVLAIMDHTSAKWPETKHWFQNNMTSWVLTGIISEMSKVPIHWWNLAPHHKGISESSQYRDNEAVCRKQALLTTIIRCKHHAHEMIAKNRRAEQGGIRLSWRSLDRSYRIEKQMNGTELMQIVALKSLIYHGTRLIHTTALNKQCSPRTHYQIQLRRLVQAQ